MNNKEQVEDLGQPTPEILKAGPTQDRSCTDIICCLLFVGLQVVMFSIAIYAWKNGDPSKLATPYDPNHRPCGVGDQANYPYIYFVTPDVSYLYRTTCVSECPSSSSDTLKCLVNDEVTSCSANASTSDASKRVQIYASVVFGNRICIPKDLTIYEKIKSSLQADKVQQIVSDLKNTWMIISCSALVAIIVSFIFLCILKMCAGIVVWSFIFIIIGGFFLLGGLLFARYRTLESATISTTSTSTTSTSSIKENLEKKLSDPKLCLYCSIIFFSLGGIILVCIFCMCTRIRLAIAILKCSSRFMTETPSALLISPICFILMCICFVYWFVVLIYLFGCGKVTTKAKALPFGQFSYTSYVKQLSWTNLFGFFWNSVFLMDSADFVIMGSVAYWYFQRNVSSGHTGKSICLFFKHHIGTVAFGSLITAIFLLLRVIVEAADRYIKANSKSAAAATKFIISCLKFVLCCCQKCIQFLNKRAYIQTIMTSKSFCPAAKDALMLILRNPLRTAITSGLGAVFQFLGTLCITIITTIICYLVITKWSYYTEMISSPICPTICFAILSFCVASFFMSLYGTSADAIVVLFCMDEEMHKSTKSNNSPPELIEIINSNNN